MKKFGIVSVLCMLAAGIWATGCGGSSGFVCDFKMSGVELCETVSDPGSDSSALTSACTAEGGTSPSSCPSANALGTCTESAGGVSETVTYYSGSGITASTAQSACTGGGGKWAAGS